jgi:amino acid adenylation domain-containing protein
MERIPKLIAVAGPGSSLVEILRRRALESPERVAFTFLGRDGGVAQELTWAALERRARGMGAALQEAGLAGERVLLLEPAGLGFVTSFLGCLYAGAVAVPAYPPGRNRGAARLRSIAADARVRAVLAPAAVAAEAGSLVARVPELVGARFLASGGLGEERADAWRETGPAVGDAAFLQYTSGSTSEPKGVVVTHGNLLHNEESIRRAFGTSEASVVVGWLPLYHDMGLIGNVLQPLYAGARAVLMAPLAFLERPAAWLEAISRYRATTAGGPDFAYGLCARKVTAAEKEGLDLSSWEVAFDGAEPVRAATLERFAAAFAPCGFRRAASFPCYGLAEATLFVSGGAPGEGPRVLAVDAAALERHRVEEVPESAPGSRLLVGCGRAAAGQTVVGIDPASREPVPPGKVGEIWVAGPSVAAGYWERPEETAGTFGARLASGEGPFLRTGDLGFLAGGELFVTGRLKDLILLRGRNHYPQDFERTAEASHPALRPGCGAAFSIDRDGEERLVVVQEVERGHGADLAALADGVRRALAEEHEVAVEEVVLLRSGTLPKTSSGKVRRAACRAAWMAGELAVLAATGRGWAADGSGSGREGEVDVAGDPEIRAAGTLRLLAAAVARALRREVREIDPETPLIALGLDSLAGAELRAAVEEETGVRVPLQTLLDGMSLRELVERIRIGRTASRQGTGATASERAIFLEPASRQGLETQDPGAGVMVSVGGAVRFRPGLVDPGTPAPSFEVTTSSERAADRAPAAATFWAGLAPGHGGIAEEPRGTGPSVEPATDEPGKHLLSEGQRALWFLDRLDPAAAALHLAGAARVRGGIDPEALGRALDLLTGRHPALRTTFEARGGEPVRRVHARLEPDLEVGQFARGAVPGLPLSRIRRSEDAATLSDLLAAEAFRPFDLVRGPLLRIRLWSLPDGDVVLLLAVHHLIVDFTSVALLLADLVALYAQERGGPPARLPPPGRGHSSWIGRQEELLAGPRGEALRDWWHRRLSGDLPLLELPADRPRPAARSWRGHVRTLRLPGTAAALRSVARSRGITLYATLLAGFQAVLHRWTGEPQALVGAPTAGRGAGLAREIGYFVNPVVLRLDLPDDPPFAELAARAGSVAMEAFEHADYPFPRLARELRLDRDAGRSLLRAMLVLQPGRSAEERALAPFALREAGARTILGGLDLESLALPESRAQLDCTLMAAAGEDGGLALSLELDADLFDSTTAERLLGHLGRFLETAAAEPGRRVTEIEILSAGEREELAAWSTGPALEPADRCLHERIAVQVAKTPAAIALVHGGDELTYGELWRRVELLAGALRTLVGVEPEVRVGVCCRRTPGMVVALLAVLEAGGAYVPLDPAYPAERLAYLVEDSGAALVLMDETGEARLPEVEGVDRYRLGAAPAGFQLARPEPDTPPVERAAAEEIPASCPREGEDPGSIDLATESPRGHDERGRPAASSRPWHPLHRIGPRSQDPGEGAEATPANLAYLIYTSGSTGRPKAVAIEHRSAVVLVDWSYSAFTDRELDGMVAATSIGFDMSVFELFVPLCRGGRVILVESALDLPDLPATAGARLLDTVPSVAAELLRAGGLPAGIETVNLGGEPVRRELVRALLDAGARRVVNLYGPSEDTTFSTFADLGRHDDGEPVIGRPIAGTTARVVDAGLRPAPPRVEGELFLGGAGLARGYLGRPERTAERFVPSPFAEDGPGARLYRTGDRARFRGDGQLSFLGRFDQQVKIRGHRVEPGEIEALLVTHPEIAGAAVLASGEGAERRLVAYVVAARPLDLRPWLAACLPEPLVPSAFVSLKSLPLNPNGKIDRRALADLAPGDGTAAARPAAEPPRTPLERSLVAIWEEVLGEGGIGVHDDFFDRGGHSLLAVRVQARVRESLGLDLPLGAFFRAPTVAGLARLAADAPAWQEAPPPSPRRREGGPWPLSYAQERMWLLHRLDPQSPAYHVAAELRLDGPLDAMALEAALHGLMHRHEALRTRFPEGEGGGPVQAVEERLPGIDLSAVPAARREAAAERLAGDEARRPFDLAAVPPVRAVLVRLGAADHRLFLVQHHIVTDEASLALLAHGLAEGYAAAVAGRPSPLGAPRLQMADVALWQRRRLQGEALAARLGWWEERLAGLPPLALPADPPWPPVPSGRGGSVSAALPPSLPGRARTGFSLGGGRRGRVAGWVEDETGRYARLRPSGEGKPARGGTAAGSPPPAPGDGNRMAADAGEVTGLATLGLEGGSTLFMIVLAGFQAVLSRYSGAVDFAVGAPFAARGHPGLEEVVGPLLNTLVLRADLAGDPPFRELLGRVREATVAAHERADLPFELLVERLRPERSTGGNPLFEVIFALRRPPEPLVAAGVTMAARPVPTGTAKADLTLFALERGDGIGLELEYAADRWDRATAARLLDGLAALLTAAAADPGLRVSELPALAGAARWQLQADSPTVPRAPQAVREAPRNPVEELLAGIWEELLGIERPGIHDDFFDLGGQSLLAARVVARIRRQLGVELPLRALFEERTLAGLAARLEAARSAPSAGEPAPVPVPRGDFPGGMPLSFGQERLWFMDRLDPGSPVYNMAAAVSLAGTLDPSRLAAALAAIAGRHEVLRAAFPAPGGAPVQVEGGGQGGLPLVDLSALPTLPPNGTAPLPPASRPAGAEYPRDSHPADLPRVDGAAFLPLPGASGQAEVQRPADLAAGSTHRMSLLPLEGRPVGAGDPRGSLSADLPPPGAASRQAEALRLATAEALRPFGLAAGPPLRTALLRLEPAAHVLLVTVHHVAFDGWSFGLFLRELAALYAGEALPALPLQYADFAVWQRRRADGGALEPHLAWWREALAGAPPLAALPLDRPRPPLQTFRGGHRRIAFRPAAAGALRGLARRLEATPFMALLAGWAALLARHGAGGDLVVGTAVAGRGRLEAEPLIGLFAENLVLRLGLADDPGFDVLAGRAREATLAAWAHQEVPFERLVRELRPERDLGHAPLYQTALTLDSTHRPPLELPGLRLELLPIETGTAKLDLALYLDDRQGELSGSLEYNRDLFDPTTADRLLAAFERLIEAVPESPACRLSELPILSRAESHQLLRELAAGDRQAEEPVPVLARFARLAVNPTAASRPAVRGAGRTLTYRQLDEQATRLARRLEALGVGLEVRVAVYLPRTPEAIVALLAIWKAGGVYVPLDPTHPEERLRRQLDDCRAQVLIASRRGPEPPVWSGGSPGGPGPLFVEDEAAADLSGNLTGECCPNGIPGLPESAACLLYTSGSTGRPKGVVVPQGALATYAASVASLYRVGPGDRVLQSASPAFDLSLDEIVPSLIGGAELVLRDDALLASPEGFLAGCGDLGITVLVLPTAYWHELALHLDRCPAGAPGILPPTLRLVTAGGERLSPERLSAWRSHFAGPLFNTYGPTEATIQVTAIDLNTPSMDPRPEVPLGRPLPGATVHLLDPQTGAPMPRGAIGEIHLGGAVLARGYLDHPAETAERFVPNPLAQSPDGPGMRLYRTGDLARLLPDGTLEFAGRLDGQVKIRGYRVEPGEIEAVLASHPSIEAAAVTVHPDTTTPGGHRLAAHVVLQSSATLTVPELRAHLSATLPAPLVPKELIFLDALPLNPHGKIDRKALQSSQAASSPESNPEAIPPRDEAEWAVAALWREVLHLDRVGAHDNFFDLGGHSLALAQVHVLLHERLGHQIPVVELFRHPTVATLARHLSSARPTSNLPEGGPPPPVPSTGGERPGRPSPERDGEHPQPLPPGQRPHATSARLRRGDARAASGGGPKPGSQAQPQPPAKARFLEARKRLASASSAVSPSPWGARAEALHHQRLSPAAGAFLRFAAANRESLSRATFANLDHHGVGSPYPLQPWPALVDRARVAEMERVSTGLARLIKSLPQRLFGDDPESLQRFYGLPSRDLASRMVQPPDGRAEAIGRGDFLESADGLQCLEFNLMSALGGWEAPLWAEAYRQVPLFDRFLSDHRLAVRCRDTVALLLAHAVAQARALGEADGEINTALVTPEHTAGAHGHHLEAWLAPRYAAALAPWGAAGTLSIVPYGSLAERAGVLLHGDRRLHAAVELHEEGTAAPALRAFRAGSLALFNAPVRAVLTDKRNLALLSELADAEDARLDAAERELVARHVPWTRRLLPGTAAWHGREIPLPDLAIAAREELVLKQARAGRGAAVFLGATTPASLWRQKVEEALRQEDWILQQRVEPLPYIHQHGEHGWAIHDVVWGLFVLGDHYGGSFLSLAPREARTREGGGVINVMRGATVGVVFEVGDE